MSTCSSRDPSLERYMYILCSRPTYLAPQRPGNTLPIPTAYPYHISDHQSLDTGCPWIGEYLGSKRWVSGFMTGGPCREAHPVPHSHQARPQGPGKSVPTPTANMQQSLGPGCYWRSESLCSHLHGPALQVLTHWETSHAPPQPPNPRNPGATILHCTYDIWSLGHDCTWKGAPSASSATTRFMGRPATKGRENT